MSSDEKAVQQVETTELSEKVTLQSGGEVVQVVESSKEETLPSGEETKQVEITEPSEAETLQSGEGTVQQVEINEQSGAVTLQSGEDTEQREERNEPSVEENVSLQDDTEQPVEMTETSESETLQSGEGTVQRVAMESSEEETLSSVEEMVQLVESTVMPVQDASQTNTPIWAFIQERKKLILLVTAVIIAGIFGVILVVKFSTDKGSPLDQTHQNAHQNAQQPMNNDCEDPTTVIQPENTECEEGSDSCFKCKETIPSAGYRDLNDSKTCENYTMSDDGKLLYIGNRSFDETEILNGTVLPLGKEEKKYLQTCCILKLMRSKSEPCPEDYEYKCPEYNSAPECQCKKNRVCANNSIITVPCKCFWSSCNFADQKAIEDCRNPTKKPDFKLCLLLFSMFKCQCVSQTADEKLRNCSAVENNASYHPTQQKGSYEIAHKGDVSYLTIFICAILTLLFMMYCSM